MNKFGIIGDLHLGFKNDSPIFDKYFEKFFDDVFFPELEKRKITTLVITGDIFDRRKYVNFQTLQSSKKYFFDKLKEKNINMYCILGNHDVYYRNTNEVNSLELLLKEYENIKIFSEPQDFEIDGISYGFIPWITDSNRDKFYDFLKTSKSSILFGHLEVIGFEVDRGIKSMVGLDRNIFKKFEKVYSGHFHQKHDDGKIFYLGTPYDMTFADLNETKGFHVYDPSSKDLEFIKNPYKLFYTLEYDDITEGRGFKIPDFSKYKDSYVQVIVKGKKYPTVFDKYINTLYAVNPADVRIIEPLELTSTGITGDIEIDSSEDTIKIICKEVDGIENLDNAEELKNLMKDLYTESFNIED